MKVVNNHKKCLCMICLLPITTRRKVKLNKKYYHLICMLDEIDRDIARFKLKISHLRPIRQRLQRYKKEMILERLQ